MIHQYSRNGINIVLDVESGAVHILDDLPYKILTYIDEDNIAAECPAIVYKELTGYSDSDISFAYSELYFLYKKGML